jgi:hypothetical protein
MKKLAHNREISIRTSDLGDHLMPNDLLSHRMTNAKALNETTSPPSLPLPLRG